MPLTIEGYTLQEVLALPPDDVNRFLFCAEPVVLRMGEARVLAEFLRTDDALIIELAQIENGGEGVLPALWGLAPAFAARRGLRRVEWIVHAVYCATPNPRLRRLLERKGFTLGRVPEVGEAYFLSREV